MRMLFRRCLFVLVALALWVAPATAQSYRVSTGDDRLDVVGECVTLDVQGMGRAVFEVRGNTGTVDFEVAGPSASDFEAIDVVPPDDADGVVTSTTGNGAWAGDVAGWRTARACLTAAGVARVRISAAASGGGGRALAEPVTVDGEAFTSIATEVTAVKDEVAAMRASLSAALTDQTLIDLSSAGTTELLPAGAGVEYHALVSIKAQGAVTVSGIIGTETTTPCDTDPEVKWKVTLSADQPYWVVGFHVPEGSQACLTLSAGVVTEGTVEF